MKNTKFLLIVFLLLLTVAACGGSGSDTEEETSPADAELVATSASAQSEEDASDPQATSVVDQPVAASGTTGSFFAINEIGLGSDGFVALNNFTDVPVSLGGLYLCQGTDCFALPDEVVAAGETVRIAAGDGDGFENVVATEATYGELRPANGEMTIFTSEETSDPQALLVYLQWGSTPHVLTDLAINKGIWLETSYAPSGENATRLFRVEESGLWLWE